MGRTLREDVVRCLGFTEDVRDHFDCLGRASRRDWEQTLGWLDHAGLALYFLDALQTKNAEDALPPPVLVRLQKDLENNRQRIALMGDAFQAINQAFNRAGIRYAVQKGFSLQPQFCLDVALRAQSDLDYLVADDSIASAQRALEDTGYVLKSKYPGELVYWRPAPLKPGSDQQYSPEAPYVVELHLSIWKHSLSHFRSSTSDFNLDRVRAHPWRGSAFPDLPQEEIFLVQTLHSFAHILDGWIKMSWLFELGFFLNHWASNDTFWAQVEQRVGEDRIVREFVAIVAEIVARVFGAPIPAVLAAWAQELRPGARVWIENYSHPWLFRKYLCADELAPFSPTNLPLFLHREYVSDPVTRRSVTARCLFRWDVTMTLKEKISASKFTRLSSFSQKSRWLWSRSVSHSSSTLRYFWEVPRWRRLKKAVADGPKPL